MTEYVGVVEILRVMEKLTLDQLLGFQEGLALLVAKRKEEQVRRDECHRV